MEGLAASIRKFDGTGFEVWSTLVEAVFAAKKIRYVLTDAKPEKDSELKKWTDDNNAVRATLLLTLDPSIVSLVIRCETAKEIWDRLREVHSQQSVSCKMVLYQQFYSIKMQPGTMVSTYVSETELIVKKLRDIGVSIDDETLIGKIVSGLTPDFRHFMSNWMGTPEKERTYANLLPRLMTEESMMIRSIQEEPVALKASTVHPQQIKKNRRKKKNKTDLECYHCGRKGHLKRECRTLKREQETAGEGDKRYATVAKVSKVTTSKGRFYFDSGASYHMSHDLEWLDDYKVHERPIEIIVGNNETVYALGSGTIDAVSIVDGEKVAVKIQDVQYVPAISDNLFSQGACDRKGHTIITKHGKLDVVANGKTIIQGVRTAANMYVLDFQIQARANIARAERSIEEWHQVLGHPDINEIKNLAEKGCTRDLKIVQRKVEVDTCGDCPPGKAHHASHPDSKRERSTVPLHRVHADLVGPVEPPTLNRARYFMLIKDECTSYMYVYFMRTKDETLGKIRQFINEASITAQHRVQVICSDNGFKNTSVRLLCDTEGIVQEFSAPRTPQQNGEAERANRTVLETARTLLHSSIFSLNLWGEAVLTAVYLRNRLTNSRSRDRTPFELFHGRSPGYSHLIEFGKAIHVVDARRGESKFSSKTLECFMVGYGPRDRTYRCYNPVTQDIIISSSIVVAPHKRQPLQAKLVERPQIIFPVSDGGASGDDDQSDAGAYANESAVGPGTEQQRGDQHIYAEVQTPQEACSDLNVATDDRPVSMLEQQPTNERQQAPAREERLAAHAVPPAQAVAPVAQTERAAPPVQRTGQRATAPVPRVQFAPATSLRRIPVVTNLSQPTSETIRLAGRGLVTTTPVSRPIDHSARITAPHQAGRAVQTNVPATINTRAAVAPSATSAGVSGTTTSTVGGSVAQSRLSPRKLLDRMASSIRSRPKRTTASKYARLAVAVDDEPSTFAEAMASSDKVEWQKAISEELSALARNNTWQIVPKHSGTREITVKWVFKKKLDANGEVDRFKARLVARGFSQVAGLDYGEVYAPVVHTDSLRLLFSICSQLNLVFEQFDIATAFLNGELDELIHIKPPEGLEVPAQHSLKLLKSLYGLKQAPRCFNKKFKQVLSKLNMRQIYADPCVFTGNGEELIILALYVDDGIVFSKEHNTIGKLMNGLEREFDLKKVTTNYFLGLEIIRNRADSTIFLHQRAYAKSVLAKFGFTESRAVATPLEAGHTLNKPETLSSDKYDCPYQELLGSLNYLATRTRPDLAYALSICSKYADKPREQHWQALKRVMRYLRGTLDHGLIYMPITDPRILIYSDADYGGDHANRRSTSGMACFINTGLVSFKAQQQQTVTMSTTEAEYIACTVAVKELMWIKTFLDELKVPISTNATLRCDNQSAIRLIKNSELHQRTKHIDIRHHFIREKYEEGLFTVEYVQTDEQLADVFTKALTKDKHQGLCEAIGCVALGSLSPGRVLE